MSSVNKFSGKYYVDYIAILTNDVSQDSNGEEILKGLGIMNAQGKINEDKKKQVSGFVNAGPKRKLFVTENGGLRIGTEEESKASSSNIEESKNEEKEAEESVMSETFTSEEELIKFMTGSVSTIKEEDVQEILQEYMKTLPKGGDGYAQGEVEIKFFAEAEVNITSLLAAGTKVLDAILFTGYHNDEGNKHIFHTRQMEYAKTSKIMVAKNITEGQKAIKAAFTIVYNQGSLPSLGNPNENLSKFIRSTIFKDASLTNRRLCKMLSSTEPTKFPARIFLNINLTYVPNDVASRCKLSIAGNKAIRYALFAKKFERASLATEPTNPTREQLENFIAAKARHELAGEIVTYLVSLGSSWEAQLRMHPLAPKRKVIKDFTLKLIRAILEYLSLAGRLAMADSIDKQKIESFRKDVNIFGELGPDNLKHFPLLKNADADFGTLTMEAVKEAYSSK